MTNPSGTLKPSPSMAARFTALFPARPASGTVSSRNVTTLRVSVTTN
ncbi:hypothetical protein HNP84_002624 [Thermocatellispora tengchongensis]|uniref:Uncharacterized protein n=1 Tax=Thermocatellispora tengchongensis TaxID=1073253 RepID=A0A840P4S2_9ACTN|nr:hypothetical protein [Thermocatellispora tengchongensis]